MNARQKYALISVFTKTGIELVALRLVKLGYKIISSGGTATYLKEHGIDVIDLGTLVGKPILGHKVVTLSRYVHAALLCDLGNEQEMAELVAERIEPIDLVICDLYPLEQTIAAGFNRDAVIKKTDIGGPTMISSAAKGGRPVAATPGDIEGLLHWLENEMPDAEKFMQNNQAKADLVVSMYRMISAQYHSKDTFFGTFSQLHEVLRYGENPHQAGAMHLIPIAPSNDPLALQNFEQLEGAVPSAINKTDLSSAVNALNLIALTLAENGLWSKSAKIAVVVKHGIACGFGYDANDASKAIKSMVAGDPIAAFGGAMVTNFTLDHAAAELLKTYKLEVGSKRVYDLVAAPSISPEAIDLLARKDDKCRIYINEALLSIAEIDMPTEQVVKQVRGGTIVFDAPKLIFELKSGKVTIFQKVETGLTERELLDLCIAHAICGLTRSNTITYVKNGTLLVNAASQPSRVQCVEVANAKMKVFHPGITDFVVASDSFFPATDGPLKIAEAGAKVVFATTGSLTDTAVKKVFSDCDMIFVTMKDMHGRLFFGH